MMICEDFLMLGKTVPEPNSDGRVFVCSAGYSAEMRQLLRIYPLARRGAPQRWSLSAVPLERNPKDSRPESWKLAGDRHGDAHERINQCFGVQRVIRSGWEKKEALDDDRIWVSSIKEANERRMSLALLQPKSCPTLQFDQNSNSPDSPQLRLFDEGLPKAEGAKRFPFIPRMVFDDSRGEHCLMLRDWGCYELMRKHPARTFEMDQALSLDADSVLLIGNMNQHRTSWLVISVLNIGVQQMSLAVGL